MSERKVRKKILIAIGIIICICTIAGAVVLYQNSSATINITLTNGQASPVQIQFSNDNQNWSSVLNLNNDGIFYGRVLLAYNFSTNFLITVSCDEGFTWGQIPNVPDDIISFKVNGNDILLDNTYQVSQSPSPNDCCEFTILTPEFNLLWANQPYVVPIEITFNSGAVGHYHIKAEFVEI